MFGSGLRGSPTIDNAVTFSYEDLLRMPSTSVISFIECAGNGREFFWLQQDEAVTSVPWLLGGIGVAEWRGVRLADILDRAGLTPDAIDVMPQGLDPDYVTGGVDYGQVGQIEVSATPLFSWWNTLGYRPVRPRLPGRGLPSAWQLWDIPWQPPGPGSYTLRARATDVTGATQPVTVPFNTREYLFDGIVDHPVTVT
ncbi:MAG TPA: molybdopterin-dependent oxidoreductase [Streptosporangiaceae bacterium]|nr:molybdopterin-dependent oxidoreductase [Streptosporangiaceae bacterium]